MEDLFAKLRGGACHPGPEEVRLPDLTPRPEHRHEPFPLTDIQQAYLIGRHKSLELGGISSQYYLEFDCPGLDVDRLTEALGRVVDRHDALRTVVGPDQTQRVLPAGEAEPCLVRGTDLRGRTAAEQSAEVERIRAELTEQVLPVDRAPLLDARATLLDGDRVRLHLAVDLLFLDMRGLYLLLDEWRRFYDDPAWLPEPLELSFRDHVLAQEELRADTPGKEAAAYWADHLDALPPRPSCRWPRRPNSSASRASSGIGRSSRRSDGRRCGRRPTGTVSPRRACCSPRTPRWCGRGRGGRSSP